MTLRLSTLRARLLLIVGLALAPTLALSLYNYTDLRRQAGEAAQRELLRLARLASERYGRVVDAGRQLLMAKLAEKSVFKPPAGLKADIEAALARASSRTPRP